MEVIPPDARLRVCSIPGEYGMSIDTFEEFLVCRDDREPVELTLSNSLAAYLPSSAAFFLSFLALREKNDLPPEDCLDLLSAADMIGGRGMSGFDHGGAPCGYSPVGCA
jgi:hypothetical protein